MKKNFKINGIKFVKILDTICYLLPCTNGYILVDTGYPGKYRQFVKKLKKSGVDISQIKYILLTHHHHDHAGIVREIRETTNARLIVHRAEIAPLQKGVSFVGEPVNVLVRILKKIYSLCADFSYSAITIKDQDIIIDGDNKRILPELGCDGTILHTPGHTNGSLSIVLSDGTALVGDVVMNQSRLWFSSPKPIVMDSMDEVYRSWNKLKQNDARVILPAHGRALSINDIIINQSQKY
jgi:glyoxylase-like metal-dependent hydrolase (beta-lactamase superfamily II)